MLRAETAQPMLWTALGRAVERYERLRSPSGPLVRHWVAGGTSVCGITREWLEALPLGPRSPQVFTCGPCLAAKLEWSPSIHIARQSTFGGRPCVLGLHPGYSKPDGARVPVTNGCTCMSFADERCCVDLTPCQVHKCGPRKGCRCPVREAARA